MNPDLLMLADLFVRQQLQKEAAVVADAARGVMGALKGTGRVVQKGFSEAGGQAAKEIGGVGGKVVGGAIKATPAVAAGGAALYGVESAAGHPMQRYVDQKRQQLAQRVQGSQAYQQGGVYY